MSQPQPTPCLICAQPLAVRLAYGRKSGKPFVSLTCPKDGRHFRAFINDREFVSGFLARLEGHTQVDQARVDLDNDSTPPRRSKTNLERGR